MMLHVNWGHASAHHFKRILADSDRNNLHLLTCVDKVLAQRGVCQAFEEAPHIPAAGTSTVAMLREKLQVGLLFLDDIIALHVMDACSRYSLLTPARTKNHREVWGAFCSSSIGVCGPPLSIRMDEGEERKNELSTELRTER